MTKEDNSNTKAEPVQVVQPTPSKGIHTESVGGKTVFVGEGSTTPSEDTKDSSTSLESPFIYTPIQPTHAADVVRGINIRLDAQRATGGLKVMVAVTQLDGKDLAAVEVFLDGARIFPNSQRDKNFHGSQMEWEGTFGAGMESTVLVQVTDEDGDMASSVKTVSLMN